MLSNKFVFFIVGITFVSVYSLSDSISSFSNIHYIALGQGKQDSALMVLRRSTRESFSDVKFVIIESCNNAISPDV